MLFIRRFILSFSLILLSNLSFSQDIIIKKSNDTIFCKIIEISDSLISYTSNNNYDDSIDTKHIQNIKIIYAKEAIYNFTNISHNNTYFINTGLGTQIGGTGLRTTIGYKNSGLLITYGFLGDGSYSIGGQLSMYNMYLSYSYGTLISYSLSIGSNNYRGTLDGNIFGIGAIFPISNNKRFTFSFGFNYGIADDISVGGIHLSIGVNFFGINKENEKLKFVL